MDKLKILVVEDDKEQQQIFSDSVDVYKDKHKCDIEFLFAQSLEEALKIVDGSFDGVILDLKLNEEEDGGNQVAENMLKSFFRVPIIFVTGFPELVDNNNPLIIKSRSRESERYEDDIDLFFEIYNTGLTKIMGGRGKIEQTLNEVFLKNLLPQLEAWKVYGKSDSLRTEKALLRFTLNHLVQILDDDNDRCFPEEIYIYPPLSDGLKTGSILKKKDGERLYAILNPACDLVVRNNGEYKTDRI
ncbi:MAG: response regulator, partial [Deltaproteobacteria bacterium]|nr:response regulator [Deltaproteobacteria bacterium]